ncbi:2'-5' RNA ligase family protein [Myroides sp. LJL119]
MNQTNKYSICFLPDQKTIEQVAQMKLALAEHIGWFNSKNAIAHITIAEFQAQKTQIDHLKPILSRCCAHFKPIDVYLQEFKNFPNGAFYLDIDPQASIILQDYAKQINQILPFKKITTSTLPHLSIARKLTSAKVQQAFEFFEKPDLKMHCQGIALRKLNTEKLQFDIIENFSFLSKEQTYQKQLSLF